MGKKRQKKKDLNISTSYSEQNSTDSSCSSFNVSSKSINEGSIAVPDKLFVASVESAGCSAYERYLTSDWQDIVLLHPSVMKEYNIEDMAIIKNEEKTVLCDVLALQHLRKDFIVFPKGNCPIKYQESVSVCNFEGTVKDAEEIFVTYDEHSEVYRDKFDPYVLRQLYIKYLYEGMVVKWKLLGRNYSCVIQKISCSLDISNLNLKSNSDCSIPTFYKTTYKTTLSSKTLANSEVKAIIDFSAFDKIGGMEKQKKDIYRYLEMFFKSDSFTDSIYCGTLLLSGPPGTGKSLLLESIMDAYKIYVEEIHWPYLYEAYLSEGSKKLREAFQRAKKRAPSVLVFDDLNFVSSDNSVNSPNSLKKCSQLLKIIDDAKVFVLTATNDSDFNSSILQTSKRLVETIKTQIPSSLEREDILKKLLDSRNHDLSIEEVHKCASMAHGFTGRDLSEVIKDAQILSIRRDFSDILDSPEYIDIVRKRGPDKGRISFHDLESTLKLYKPSIVTSELVVKKVYWSDIGGMSEVKEKLKEVVEWPLKYPESFKRFNIAPTRGVLMYGPPGCSKTMIAKALATECELNFISKNASDLYDKYVGESEKAVRYLFAMAKAKSPCIIFLDEIDALVSERGSSSSSSGVGDRIVTTLLTEMDGVEELHGVIIIAATNRPDMLDDALVRNGRINHFIYVPLPDAETREEILKISMKKRILSEDFDFKVLVKKTEGYSGAEIVNLCNEAAFQLLSEDPEAETPTFRLCHFEKAFTYIVPRTDKDMIEFYEKFNEKHCRL